MDVAAVDEKTAEAAAAAAAVSGRVRVRERRAWLERQWSAEWNKWSAKLRQELLVTAWSRLEPSARLLLDKALEYRMVHGLHFEVKLRRQRARDEAYAPAEGPSEWGSWQALRSSVTLRLE